MQIVDITMVRSLKAMLIYDVICKVFFTVVECDEAENYFDRADKLIVIALKNKASKEVGFRMSLLNDHT